MKFSFSVNTWKRIITITTLAIIVGLIVSVFVASHKNKVLKSEIEDLHAFEVDEQTVKEANDTRTGEMPDYSYTHPTLYVENDFVFDAEEPEKVCYLTFDDGPAPGYTEKILDTLKKYDAKATFFVVYNDSDAAKNLYNRMIEEGHTIGVHTSSHNYSKIYENVDNFLDDFDKVSRFVTEVTGYKPEIFRFPGGSINSYNIGNYQDIISEMLRRGYTYYDWNISSGDAASSVVSKENIVNNTVKGVLSTNKAIVLMHDGSGHKSTVKALPEVIEKLKAEGYEFRALSNDVKPTWFGYY